MVFTFATGGDTSRGQSWFRRGWPGYKDTYPFSSSIDYSQFVVELESVNDMVPKLGSLIADRLLIERMQSALGRVAQKIVYGLGDEFTAPGDAFDSLLKELEDYISNPHDEEKQQPAASNRSTEADFCHNCLWTGSMTCTARLNYMIQKYGSDRQEAIEGMVVQSPQCKVIPNE